ncbi:hypothetical protein LEMLEM_LOCUS14623 [Lemmus lemmus]
MQDPQESDCCRLCPKQGRMVIQGSCFIGETARHSTGHRGKRLTSCQYRWDSLSNFLLHGKVCQILWAYRLKMEARTLSDCPGNQMSLSFLEFLEVICIVLFVYLNNIISFWCL